jgi:3',5'-cyclic AMP phosphodiesterase CpdA
VPEPFTLIHVSDLHFHTLPRRPGQWLSKRGVGALNLLLRRRWQFPRERARRLVRQVDRMAWDHLVISGDVTQLGLPEEFALARAELAPWLARGAGRVTVIPGNHDRYVPEDGAPGPFDAHFGPFAPQGPERFAAKQLNAQWWLAAWDSAVPRPVFQACGIVAAETLRATEHWLAGLPRGARVVLTNHYPLQFPSYHRVYRFHELLNLEEVRDWIARQPIELYLHGHVHHNWTLTQPGVHGPLLLVNSASSTQVPGLRDPSSFHRIRLPDQGPPVIEPIAAK